MMTSDRSASLPHLAVITAEGEEQELGDQEQPVISPLTPKLTPTFRAQTHLSPFWFSTASNTPELAQVTGSTSASPAPGPSSPSQAAPLSMLHAAAITGNTEALEKLASGNFCDIDLRDKFGRTPLMYAVLGNYPECVEILVDNKSDLSLTDSSGRSALHWAAHHGYGGCARSLVRAGAGGGQGWGVPDQAGVTVLHLAMRHDKSVLQHLLKKIKLSKEEVNVLDVNKRSPLHWACAHGNLDQVKIISKLGADIGIIDVEGKTALHFAAMSNSSQPGKLLGALVNMKTRGSSSVLCWQDYDGRQPLHLAVISANPDMVAAIIKQPSCMINALDQRDRTPLHYAAIHGQEDIVRLLLEAGAKSDTLDEAGASAGHLAVQSGDEKTVRVFIDKNQCQQLDSQRRTPLMWAVALERVAMVESLVSCDPDTRDKMGYSALHIAVSNNVLSCIQPLISLGAGINIRNDEGETPAMLASKQGHEEILALLLKCGADINLVDVWGGGCLHLASVSGHLPCMTLLLKNGVKVDLSDNSGTTALMMASSGGHKAAVTMLLEAGASLDKQNGQGMCALYSAVHGGHLDLVRMFLEAGAYPNNVVRTREGQWTALDTAMRKELTEITNVLLENKAVTIARIYNIAATRIQAYYRGYKIRNTYTTEVKNLMFKHNKLLKEKENRPKDGKGKKKKRRRRKDSDKNSDSQSAKDNESSRKSSDPKLVSQKHIIAGDFLGSVIEGHQRSSYLRRVQPGEDQPLPESRMGMTRSKSVTSGGQEGGHHRHHKRTGSGAESHLQFPGSQKERSDSRFSYNLNK